MWCRYMYDIMHRRMHAYIYLYLYLFWQRIEKRFSFTATKDGDMHGLCSWFDVSFDPITEEYKDHVVLSTSPSHPYDHVMIIMLHADTSFGIV